MSGWEDLRRAGGGETVIKIHCIDFLFSIKIALLKKLIIWKPVLNRYSITVICLILTTKKVSFFSYLGNDFYIFIF